MATLQDILAAILNPNGSQQAQPPVMGGAPTQVGDGNNPALLQAQMARFAQPQQQAMPPQAPQGQPMQQNAPQPAPVANGGGLGGLGGILQNIIAPQSAQKNKTVGWLTSQGLDPGTATILASDKGALRSYILSRSQGKVSEFDQRAAAADQYGLTDPAERRNYILGNKLGGEGDGQTSDQKEYQYAVQHDGFKGSFMDFMVKMKEAGRNQVNIDTGTKLPSGYMWKDPNNQTAGVVPIPGGPATQLPSEAAGRIGLADSFLNNFETIKKKVASGVVTGPLDRFQATNNSSSEAGQVYQAIQTGVDSLQRMLTGAGMPASEASQYAYRYLPGYTDTAESAASKLDRLKSELESVQKKVMQGRGGDQAQTAPEQTKAPPSVGELRYGYRFKGGDPSEPSNWEKAQ